MVVPGPRELQLDIDSQAATDQYTAMADIFRKNGECFTETSRTTSAGGNTHIYVTIPCGWPDLDSTTRVALQACFGSDLTREALSLLRILRRYDIPPICLFECPPNRVPARLVKDDSGDTVKVDDPRADA